MFLQCSHESDNIVTFLQRPPLHLHQFAVVLAFATTPYIVVIMNDTLIHDFDAQRALNDSAVSTRVQLSEEQHLLDICQKNRTSALPWRGQFSPQLIEYLLDKHCTGGSTVLEPFCGSGTVLHEAARANMNAVGLDVNPAAVCLAKVSEIARYKIEVRWKLIEKVREFSVQLHKMACREEGNVIASDAVELLNEKHLDYVERVAFEGFLLFVFANGHKAPQRSIAKRRDRYIWTLLDIPKFNGRIEANVGDARAVKADDNTFDYLVTSPPYINVFNYHQNYRPIIEALGHTPLAAARSELGANRKFRQNRYMTVVQYCMDMAQFFVEAGRVLKDDASLTIVLGRESNVRSVPFKNGEMISAIACEGMGFRLTDWHERKFMNRFGESIYEDVMTIVPSIARGTHAIEIGRSVGTQALQNALNYCPPERSDEISDAIDSAKKIENSPLVQDSVQCFK